MNMPATQLTSLAGALAAKLELGISGTELMETLKATAFKGQVTDAQMSALLIVAKQYGLNPWTKEIYAYPDKQNGIVPVVGVDGWSRIINEHPQYNGVEFNYSPEIISHKGKTAHEWVECILFRKDREKPTIIREYFDEVCRAANFVTPWDTHPKRLHRHKALIQCARVAFGFSGIYDEDEAERIIEKDITPKQSNVEPIRPAIVEYSQTDFEKNFPAWEKLIQSGKKTSDAIIAMVGSKAQLTEEQIKTIKSIAAPIEGEAVEVAQ